jgi:YjjW family glycine radical enzyme activase
MTTGFISKILLQSFVDGPGNRAVVFFQRCNLRCVYCHNPSTLERCRDCGDCIFVCPAGALRMDGARVRWDAGRCRDCEACVEACPHFSTPRVWELTAEELWERIRPHADFLAGVTASGGEATLQLDFLMAFFPLVNGASRLTTMIETNGCLEAGALSRLLPVLDSAIVDLKAFDDEVHRQLAGAGNERTKETIAILARAGKLDSVRVTVVPGFNDTRDEAVETARFLRSLDPRIPLRFQRFRAHGTRGAAALWPSPTDDDLDALCAAAREAGIANVSRSL